MTKLFDVLLPEAQEDLLRNGVIELVTVAADAVPDPDRPGDRLAMQVSAELNHDFREGIPWIETELSRIPAICSTAGDDLSAATRQGLAGALDQRCREMDEWREGKAGGKPVAYRSEPWMTEILTPEFFRLNKMVTVWCHAWTVEMEDDGRMVVDTDLPFFFEGTDGSSRGRINERLQKVNAVIGNVVGRLVGGDMR
ncbi:MAG: hypothetical protein PHT99_04145 [Methanoregula sp.]|nr:hypothetical protein [Methanoregula sp.]